MNTDVLNKLLKWLDHNRYLVLSLLLFAVCLGWVVGMVGCQSQTAGLLPPAGGEAVVKVDRSEFNRQAATVEKDLSIQRVNLDAEVAAFNREVDAFNQRVESGLEELDKQDEFRQQILDTVGLVASQAAEGSLNPVSLIPLSIGLLGGALGLGAAADNRRKDRVITDLKLTTSNASIGG